MKKIYKSLILKIMILTSFLFIVSFLGKNYKEVYASTISSEEIMQKEVENLKEKNKNLEEKYSELSKTFDKIIGIVTGVSAVFGVSVFYLVKQSNKIAQKHIAKKIGEETDRIKSMIKACKKEEKLKNEKNILVISENDQEEQEIQKLLKPFKKITTIKIIDNSKELNKYDVILFNDINGNIQNEDMKKIINKNSNDKAVYFYFNKRDIKDPNKKPKIFIYEGNENINYAKSNTTFYGNLIDLMKYQEEILKKKN